MGIGRLISKTIVVTLTVVIILWVLWTLYAYQDKFVEFARSGGLVGWIERLKK